MECKEPINLQQGMYLLAVFTYSQFKICNRHFLILYKRLQLVRTKLAILAICVRQFWNARANHLSLLEVVQNNQKQFKKDLLFLIDLAETTKAKSSGGLVPKPEQERATCFGVLAPETEQGRVTSSVILGHETIPSPSILGDQYHAPTFIVKVLTKKRTFPPKSTLLSKQLKQLHEKNV